MLTTDSVRLVKHIKGRELKRKSHINTQVFSQPFLSVPCLEFFLGTPVHISIVYLSETEGAPPWLGTLSQIISEF